MLYKYNNQIYDYSPLQIEQGLAEGEPLTEEEIEEFNKPKEKTLQDKINEAKAFLNSTDYCIVKCIENGSDIEVEYSELKGKREQAREIIRQGEQNAENS